MRLSSASIYPACAAVTAFFTTIWLLPFYTEGDQLHYIHFYESISSFGLYDGYVFYRNSLGASEPVYFLLSFVLSGAINKTIFIAIANSILVWAIFKLLKKFNTSALNLVLLGFNFYLLVVLFPAERLKFGFLFGFLALATNRFKYVFYALAALSHVQLVILIAVAHCGLGVKVISDFLYGKLRRGVGLVLTFIALTVPILWVYSDHIFNKYVAYMSSGGAQEMIKPGLFLVLTLISIPKRRALLIEVVFVFVIILMMAFFVGSDRVTMLAYLVYVAYALKVQRSNSTLLLIVNMYYFVKGIFFIYDFYNTGTAFAVILGS